VVSILMAAGDSGNVSLRFKYS